MNVSVLIRVVNFPHLLEVRYRPVKPNDGKSFGITYTDDEVHSWSWVLQEYPFAYLFLEKSDIREEIEVFRGPVMMTFPEEKAFSVGSEYVVMTQLSTEFAGTSCKIRQRVLAYLENCYSIIGSEPAISRAGPLWRNFVYRFVKAVQERFPGLKCHRCALWCCHLRAPSTLRSSLR
jgi:hypothetical protein